MENQVKQSLIYRSGMALAAVLLLSTMNMLASYLVAESSENAATRINLAGSLRMQSYRIAKELVVIQNDSGVPDQAAILKQRAAEFEERLYRPLLANHIRSSGTDILQAAFNRVENQWLELKPLILTEDAVTPPLFDRLDQFVATIDTMVKELELQAEVKLRLLRILHGLSLLLTLIIVVVAWVSIHNKVIEPLRELVTLAGRIRKADFSVRANAAGDDELSLLASTFNEMSASLETMYRSLEDKVREKTAHLEEARAGLALLYESSRILAEEGSFVAKVQQCISRLQRYLDVEFINFYRIKDSQEKPFLISSGQSSQVLIDTPQSAAMPDHPDDKGKQHRYTLASAGEDYGYLVVGCHSGQLLTDEQERIVVALVDTLMGAIGAETRRDQAHHLALMEERSAIARELHDSLAQTLSYSKIQLTRFQILQEKGAAQAELNAVLNDIKSGLQAAYRQLRELLTTFRLQLVDQDLNSSLTLTVREFSDKGQIPVDLYNDLKNYPLNPNEEIHILQIVREALANVLRHARASRADVSLLLNQDGMAEVRINDNGKGFGSENTGPSHYGRIIMSERAKTLGGALIFANNAAGGATVTLTFKPGMSRPTQTGH